jgi:integrase
MAYFTKLPSTGKWQAQIQRNGRRWSKSFPTKREAQQWANEQESHAVRLRSSGGMTFADAADKYADDVSSSKDGGKWERHRLNAMKQMPMFQDRPLAEIQAPDIAAWRDLRLYGEPPRFTPVSSSTVVREAKLLRNLFKTARYEWKKIDHYPFEGVRMPQEAEPRSVVWPWRLIKRVLRAERTGKTKEVQDAFHIALRTSMRLSEVLKAPLAFDKQGQVVNLGKTKTGRRVIPVGRIAARLLDRPAFVVDPNEASTLFAKLTRELLIDGLTFHDSRATALTHLAKKVDVMTLAKISGHKDLSLLMNTYYRPDPRGIAKRI